MKEFIFNVYSTIILYFTSWEKLGAKQSVPGQIKLALNSILCLPFVTGWVII